MNVHDLMDKILSLTPEQRRVTPFPTEWELAPDAMVKLIDLRVIGMDGFRYCFVEWATDCWERCRGGKLFLEPKVLSSLNLGAKKVRF